MKTVYSIYAYGGLGLSGPSKDEKEENVVRYEP